MEGYRFIETIRLENILSFGPGNEPFVLEPLNVLIGPNASGKSNLIQALSLLQAAPQDVREPIRTGGGIVNWLWKGALEADDATVEVTVRYPENPMSLRYRLSFGEADGRFELRDEVVEDERPQSEPGFYYQYRQGGSVLWRRGQSPRQPPLPRSDRSFLRQFRDPDFYPELTFLANEFERMKFYREWTVGPFSQVRRPQPVDGIEDFLLEDASNLAVVLNDLFKRSDVKDHLLDRLKVFYGLLRDITSDKIAGTLQISFHENGLRDSVPATRMSDGSLRYLCLLAVLCHPSPPPLVCIDEPELGLHPDIIPEVAKLLVEASSRTQLFVTTHSDVLVDALTDTPEAVIVCEKLDGATQLRRLDPEELAPWLNDYRLGQLWSSGQIGGNRW